MLIDCPNRGNAKGFPENDQKNGDFSLNTTTDSTTRQSRSHGPPWECRLRRSASAFLALARLNEEDAERPGLHSHGGPWERGSIGGGDQREVSKNDQKTGRSRSRPESRIPDHDGFDHHQALNSETNFGEHVEKSRF
jgi:hypothetical protein